MRFVLSLFVKTLAMLVLYQSTVALASPNNEPLYFYASEKGKQTLDSDAKGGNPFASAIVELLARKTLNFKSFQTELIKLTQIKSENLQKPEISLVPDLNAWQIIPKQDFEKRTALVLVFSNYSATEFIPSLSGAKHDMSRIAAAFNQAGFEVQTVIDPDIEQLDSALQEMAERSSTSDIAVLYTTGHGVEINDATYLIPNNYPFLLGSSALEEHAIRLTTLGSALHAKRANLVFYGACRNNPFAKADNP